MSNVINFPNINDSVVDDEKEIEAHVNAQIAHLEKELEELTKQLKVNERKVRRMSLASAFGLGWLLG